MSWLSYTTESVFNNALSVVTKTKRSPFFSGFTVQIRKTMCTLTYVDVHIYEHVLITCKAKGEYFQRKYSTEKR